MKFKKVLCSGTFDLLHPGHLDYFQQAKENGDYLIVVIARDKTKQKLGKPTHYPENERLEKVKAVEIVDETVLGSEDNPLQIVREKKPDIICLGYDQEVNEEELKEKLAQMNLFPEIKRMKPFQEDQYKSSLLKEKLLNSRFS